MSEREWNPGDVAMVTGRWIRTDDHSERYAVRRIGAWLSRGSIRIGDWEVSSVRPLVVIDPEDAEQVERLHEALSETCQIARRNAHTGHDVISHMQAALREFANPKPPKLDEPTGLGAVVEDAERLRWVREADGWWGNPQQFDTRTWAAIDAVRVLSHGVTEEDQ